MRQLPQESHTDRALCADNLPLKRRDLSAAHFDTKGGKMMFDPYAQFNPWNVGVYGTPQPYGFGSQQFVPAHFGFGYGMQAPVFGAVPQISPQTWFGNPYGFGQAGLFSNPVTQQVIQQIPQLLQNAHLVAQQIPQIIQQLPQIIQQNPQLMQQAPQLQQVPQVLQQAAMLAQQVPHVLQALCSTPQTLTGVPGVTPFFAAGGYRPIGFGL